MICDISVRRFCCEDISKIENYDKAISDNTQTWCCHHRLEIDGSNRISPRTLKGRGLYFHRPASELIFLTKREHQRIHHLGVHRSEEICRRMRGVKRKPYERRNPTKKEKCYAGLSILDAIVIALDPHTGSGNRKFVCDTYLKGIIPFPAVRTKLRRNEIARRILELPLV